MNGAPGMKATRVSAIAMSEDGSAVVEFVLILPLLLMLLVGLIELGRYGDYSIKVSNAARAGVSYGSQNITTAADDVGMQNAALVDAQNLASVTATSRHYCLCSAAGSSTCLAGDCPASATFPTNRRYVYVEVDTSGTLASLFNYSALPASLRTITVTSKAVMRVAQ